MMSYPCVTVPAVIAQAMDRPMGAADPLGAARGRWRLNRAGIINVYQYENEVLDFAGGRLLLRGVNGSGKSTAMNMLLPFLLTARPGRIDAAADQTGILKSWMLSGRDDAQPVGYLWIEFERRDEFLVCGCGIRATRSSDNVSTWWFVTSKRPGIDLSLVTGKTPLSADGLRAALDGDEVFGDRRRNEYRRAVRQRLFGGASIDQHIGLIHVVRSPRVGDRIDVDLPEHLVEALPHLSEQALSEAAQPLDDLEEHRRTVAELARTSEAIRGLLDVYRAYCADDVRQRVFEGRARLDAQRRSVRDEKRKQQASEDASAEVERFDAVIAEHEDVAGRLRSEISALQESRAYREGRQLDGLRDYVANLSKQCENSAARVAGRERSVEAAAEDLRRAQRCGRDDLAALNIGLAAAAELGEHCRLARRPPGPIELAEKSLAGADACEPASVFDDSRIGREIAAMDGAVLERRADVNWVDEARARLDAAEDALSRAESTRQAASSAADRAAARLSERSRSLETARHEWSDRILSWVSEARPLLREAGIGAPDAAAVLAAGPGEDDSPSNAPPKPRAALEADTNNAETLRAALEADTNNAETLRAALEADTNNAETLRAALEAECIDLIGRRHEAVAAVEFRLSDKRSTAEEARARVDELAVRTEPEPPRLGWQSAADYCLADLIDFKPHLGAAERSGLEAALESSGLLAARLIDDATLELASGELVAFAAAHEASPLSDCLEVTVPNRLSGAVEARTVAALLASISCDTSSGTTTAVAADGSFRIGSLQGRHTKERAEFIGTTARREALERDRQEASAQLAAALAAVSRSEAERAERRLSLDEARRLRGHLPSSDVIGRAAASVAEATEAADAAEAEREAAAADLAAAERASVEASDELHRTAVTLQLPPDRTGLDAVRAELQDLTTVLEKCRSRLDALGRSIAGWRSAAARWRESGEDLRHERDALARDESAHSREQARLATIEDTIGAEYAEVLATRDRCRAELEEVEARLPEARREQAGAVERKAMAIAAADVATSERARAEQACDEALRSLARALATPGLLDSLPAPDGTPPGPIVAEAAGTKGLRQVLEAVDRMLLAATDGPVVAGDGRNSGTGDGHADDENPGRVPTDRRPYGGDASGAERISADSVRQSLRRRRDTLGAGWDAEPLQPDPAMPLVVEVTGPSGKAPLAASVLAVSQQHEQMVSLLDHKQSDALRQLLEGRIAQEIAERVHGAARLVKRMNERLSAVRTAHDVGVRLRWRRSGELDPATDRMIDLLAKLPELRTPDEEGELRDALSGHLREARALQPDVPYRQLIAQTLDYKQWHEMAVMVRRPGETEARLSKRTPLSEGEKKLVTYLPLFAAVAASCDALAEQAGAARDGDNGPDVARFVVLDDAFAKVSEDNHAKLFGLLVDLDLDLIATSERLWGTHATVPELAITEVVRDARQGVILLEHYRWDGATLERRPAA